MQKSKSLAPVRRKKAITAVSAKPQAKASQSSVSGPSGTLSRTARAPMTDKNGEVRELTLEDMRGFKSFSKILPDHHASFLVKRGRPKAEITKQAVSLRLDPQVLNFFKARGNGWQSRINQTLLAIVHAAQ